MSNDEFFIRCSNLFRNSVNYYDELCNSEDIVEYNQLMSLKAEVRFVIESLCEDFPNLKGDHLQHECCNFDFYNGKCFLCGRSIW